MFVEKLEKSLRSKESASFLDCQMIFHFGLNISAVITKLTNRLGTRDGQVMRNIDGRPGRRWR